MEHRRLCLRIVLAKRPQDPRVRRMHLAAILHLERLEPRLSVDEEVDFGLRVGSPVEEVYVLSGVCGSRPEMLGHQPLQRLPDDLLRPVARSLGPQRAGHVGVE